MFKLTKLALFALGGFVLFEMAAGFFDSEVQAPSEPRPKPRRSDPGVTMTGAGQGYRIETGESDGATISHVVGRGVRGQHA